MVVVDVFFFMLLIFNRILCVDVEVFSNFSLFFVICGVDNSC